MRKPSGMIFFSKRVRRLILVTLCILFPATPAVAASLGSQVAVFPLQDLSQGHNGLDLPFTRYLMKRLRKSGTKTSRLETVIAYMSNNRLRTPGRLETYYITRLGEELGVGFVLLGTVIQRKEFPVPSLGVTLNLVRTSDARTIWSYAGGLSAADDRKLLGIGGAKSADALEPALVDRILSSWPGDTLKRQRQMPTSIDSVVLQPRQVKPGGEVHCYVRLRNLWLQSRAPRVFLKADDQIYAAKVSGDGTTYEASWIAGKEDGSFPVMLVLQWPHYGRTETERLGSYLVDGVTPLIDLSLKGAIRETDPPLFRDEVVIVPHQVIRKPIARWRITFRNKEDVLVAVQTEEGDLPQALVWQGENGFGKLERKGVYQAKLEVWDEAGNEASATSHPFALDRIPPFLEVSVVKEGQKVKLGLKDLKEHHNKVPLAFWRLEMWSKEGKLLNTAEGEDLPAKEIGMELPADAADKDIEAVLDVQDILGNTSRRKIHDIFKVSKPKKVKKKEEKKTATKAWVNEF